MKTYHCSIDIANGVIRYARTPRRLDGLLRDESGRSIPGEEILRMAHELASNGFDVMPIGCDHYDEKGHCLGHPVEASA